MSVSFSNFTNPALDVLTLNGHTFTGFGGGGNIDMQYPDPLMNYEVGTFGTAFTFNPPGGRAEMTIRVFMGHQDDDFMQALVNASSNVDAGIPPFISGTYTKVIGTTVDASYKRRVATLEGGMIVNRPGQTSSGDGSTENNYVEYIINFAKALIVTG